MRTVDTFFTGYRRETFIEDARILKNSAGEKRLKLSMRLPLTGDSLVAMPTWVGEPFNDISKPEYAVKSIASSMELDPMILRVFHLSDSDQAVISFDGVRMCSFKIERQTDSKQEHPDVVLRFNAYLPRTGKFLQFADQNFDCSLFIRYEAAQPSLLDANPNVAPVDAKSEDEEEEEEEAQPASIQ
jgi:hypothetical protein